MVSVSDILYAVACVVFVALWWRVFCFCFTVPFIVDATPEGIASRIARKKGDVAKLLRKTTLSRADLYSLVNTASVHRDVDALRALVADARLDSTEPESTKMQLVGTTRAHTRPLPPPPSLRHRARARERRVRSRAAAARDVDDDDDDSDDSDDEEVVVVRTPSVDDVGRRRESARALSKE